MADVNAFADRLKITRTEVSRKMTTGIISMSFKIKEFCL